MKGTLFVGLLLLLCAAGLQAEKVYRWVDADGGVHFSATPPPGMKVEEETLEFQRNPDPATAEKRLRGYDEAVEKRRASEALAAKQGAERSRESAERRANCETARSIIDRLENSPPGTRYRREDGSYQMYTEAERAQRISEARVSASEFCD